MLSYQKKLALLCFSYLPSWAKVAIYRLMGAKIGRGVSIGIGSYIIPYYSGYDSITIGDGSEIGDYVRIRAKKLTLGRNVVIKDETDISGEKGLVMGDDTYIDRRVIINLRRDVTIGRESGIGANCSLYTHGVWLSALDGAPVKFGEIKIGERVWIASGIFIMPGISIGDNAIIGACSVVTKDVPKDTVVAGNPAREIKKTDPAKRPTPEEKDKIASGMIEEFIDRFRERITCLEKEGGRICFAIAFRRRKLGLLRAERRSRILYASKAAGAIKGQKIRPGDIVVFLSADAETKKRLKDSGAEWIDLGSRTHSSLRTSCASLLIKSFKNNGLNLAEAGGER